MAPVLDAATWAARAKQTAANFLNQFGRDPALLASDPSGSAAWLDAVFGEIDHRGVDRDGRFYLASNSLALLGELVIARHGAGWVHHPEAADPDDQYVLAGGDLENPVRPRKIVTDAFALDRLSMVAMLSAAEAAGHSRPAAALGDLPEPLQTAIRDALAIALGSAEIGEIGFFPFSLVIAESGTNGLIRHISPDGHLVAQQLGRDTLRTVPQGTAMVAIAWDGYFPDADGKRMDAVHVEAHQIGRDRSYVVVQRYVRFYGRVSAIGDPVLHRESAPLVQGFRAADKVESSLGDGVGRF